MTDKLPPLEDDDTGKTVPVDSQRTRPSTPTGAVPPASDTQRRPATSHIPQPPPPATGQPPRVRPQTVQQVRPRGSARARRDSGMYLPLWSIGLMLLAVLGLAFGVVFLVVNMGGGMAASSTPIIRIITAVPSHTPQFVESVLATPTLPPEAQQITPQAVAPTVALQGPTLAPVEISATPQRVEVGLQVIVEGVGETGLNVRDTPGVIGTTILFQANEGEVFNILEGPQVVDGFNWWRIQNPTNPNRSGWAADAYFRVNP